jgi:very-short-patch-repair endonuclease
MEKVKVNNDDPIIKIEQYIENINLLCNWDVDVRNDILDRLHDIRIPENLNWYSVDTFNRIVTAINSIKNLDEYENLKAYFVVIKKLIMSIRGLEELYTAIETNDLNKIKNCYDNIERLRIRKGDVIELNNILGKLEKSCPKLTEELLNVNDYRKYKHFNKAWQWTQLYCYINKVNSIDIEDLINEYKQKKSLESFIINSLIEKKTWLNQIKVISQAEKRKLISWMEAVKRIGNGKGKLVTTYRRIAQIEMENCRNIIPVWIMPFNKVIENFKLSKEKFDVIIFDESSQSDIFSICALMRAKKAVIVGDDKQIGPENIGIEEISINRLINEYLNEIPQAQWFDLRTSLYETALRVFPNRLMLKEHFRSVPEIIQFSNNFYYNKSIIPLRKVNSKNALNPPIVAVKVESALRNEKKSVNIKEATELVEKVIECCNDKNYNGMSMGVISLLGDDQSQLIEDLLRNRLGEKELLRRKLICGDAYSFQGDERDVMFLSMVVANNMKFAPLTKESDRRRFNVAGSRARNQMWVFHSIDLKDLNPNCARYALLKYSENYSEYKHELNLNYVFKYQLQREIYGRIKEMGYKIIPQMKIGVYNIDFIIEGENNKAALICEGDRDKNVDITNALMQQINLERIGWNFIRIKASEYYLDKEEALKKVCEKLTELGVERLTNNEFIGKLQII